MAQGGRDGTQAHVRAAAIAAEGDDIDGLVLHRALAHLDAEGCRRSERARTGAPQLRVHPRNAPGVA